MVASIDYFWQAPPTAYATGVLLSTEDSPLRNFQSAATSWRSNVLVGYEHACVACRCKSRLRGQRSGRLDMVTGKGADYFELPRMGPFARTASEHFPGGDTRGSMLIRFSHVHGLVTKFEDAVSVSQTYASIASQMRCMRWRP